MNKVDLHFWQHQRDILAHAAGNVSCCQRHIARWKPAPVYGSYDQTGNEHRKVAAGMAIEIMRVENESC